MTSENVDTTRTSVNLKNNSDIFSKQKRSHGISKIEEEINSSEEIKKLRKVDIDISQVLQQKLLGNFSMIEPYKSASIPTIKSNINDYDLKHKETTQINKIKSWEKFTKKKSFIPNIVKKFINNDKNKRKNLSIDQVIANLKLPNPSVFPKNLKQMRELSKNQEKVIEEEIMKSFSQPGSPSDHYSLMDTNSQDNQSCLIKVCSNTDTIIFTYDDSTDNELMNNLSSPSLIPENEIICNNNANSASKNSNLPNNTSLLSGIFASKFPTPKSGIENVDHQQLETCFSPPPVNLNIPPVFSFKKNIGKELADSQLSKISFLLSAKNEPTANPELNACSLNKAQINPILQQIESFNNIYQMHKQNNFVNLPINTTCNTQTQHQKANYSQEISQLPDNSFASSNEIPEISRQNPQDLAKNNEKIEDESQLNTLNSNFIQQGSKFSEPTYKNISQSQLLVKKVPEETEISQVYQNLDLLPKNQKKLKSSDINEISFENKASPSIANQIQQNIPLPTISNPNLAIENKRSSYIISDFTLENQVCENMKISSISDLKMKDISLENKEILNTSDQLNENLPTINTKKSIANDHIPELPISENRRISGISDHGGLIGLPMNRRISGASDYGDLIPLIGNQEDINNTSRGNRRISGMSDHESINPLAGNRRISGISGFEGINNTSKWNRRISGMSDHDGINNPTSRGNRRISGISNHEGINLLAGNRRISGMSDYEGINSLIEQRRISGISDFEGINSLAENRRISDIFINERINESAEIRRSSGASDFFSMNGQNSMWRIGNTPDYSGQYIPPEKKRLSNTSNYGSLSTLNTTSSLTCNNNSIQDNTTRRISQKENKDMLDYIYRKDHLNQSLITEEFKNIHLTENNNHNKTDCRIDNREEILRLLNTFDYDYDNNCVWKLNQNNNHENNNNFNQRIEEESSSQHDDSDQEEQIMDKLEEIKKKDIIKNEKDNTNINAPQNIDFDLDSFFNL